MYGKIGKLNAVSTAVIILILIVLLVTLLIAKKVKQTATAAKSTPAAEQTQAQQKELLAPKKQLPQIRDVSEDQGLDEQLVTGQGERVLKHSSLQDLPLETISEEEPAAEQKEADQESEFKISPDLKELKELQRKGLIIY